MKITTVIDKNREEEIVIITHEERGLGEKIEKFLKSEPTELTGYRGGEIVRLSLSEIYCFSIINDKLYAVTEEEKFLIKMRLYEVERFVDSDFIKINQSCIANIGKIKRFDASLLGTLTVEFKNGYRDYVSRRQMKNVKQKLGI